MQHQNDGTVTVRIVSSNSGNTVLCGPVRVRQDATSMIVQEMNNLELDGMIQQNIEDDRFTIEHVEGKREGRRVVFTRARDDAAWRELIEFARARAVVSSAGYRVE